MEKTIFNDDKESELSSDLPWTKVPVKSVPVSAATPVVVPPAAPKVTALGTGFTGWSVKTGAGIKTPEPVKTATGAKTSETVAPKKTVAPAPIKTGADAPAPRADVRGFDRPVEHHRFTSKPYYPEPKAPKGVVPGFMEHSMLLSQVTVAPVQRKYGNDAATMKGWMAAVRQSQDDYASMKGDNIDVVAPSTVAKELSIRPPGSVPYEKCMSRFSMPFDSIPEAGDRSKYFAYGDKMFVQNDAGVIYEFAPAQLIKRKTTSRF